METQPSNDNSSSNAQEDINQHAGNKAIQVGKIYGNLTIYNTLPALIILSIIVITLVSVSGYDLRTIFKLRENKLSFVTTSIENDSFIYNLEPWMFNVDASGEDITSLSNREEVRSGLAIVYPFESSYPRIPTDSAFVEFTLENHGEILAVVDSMIVEIVASHPIPETARQNYYLPILDPEHDSVTISTTGYSYPIFEENTYKYAPNEVDLFRLKVNISDSTSPGIIEYKLKVFYHVGKLKYEAESDRHYFIANQIAVTEEQEKARQEKEITIVDAMFTGNFVLYDDCVKFIENDEMPQAEECMTQRIERFQKLASVKDMVFNDGGPQLGDSLFVRSLIRIYLGNDEGAKNDISIMINELQIEDADELLANYDTIKLKFTQLPDKGRSIILEVANSKKK